MAQRPIYPQHLAPIMCEQTEIRYMQDTHHELHYALEQIRCVVLAATMDEEDRAELLSSLNDVYNYLRTPLEDRLQDAKNRKN